DEIPGGRAIDRERGDCASHQRLVLIGNGAFQILRIMFNAADDEDVFEAPCDEQLAIAHEAEVPGTQEWTLAVPCVCAERARVLFLFRPLPIPACHARAGDPDLPCLTGDTGLRARRIDDE